jgi:hypothetical protein
MMSVVMLNVVILSVMAPHNTSATAMPCKFFKVGKYDRGAVS